MKTRFLMLVASLAGIALLSSCARGISCNCSRPYVPPTISFKEMSKMAPFTATVEGVDVDRSTFSSRDTVELRLQRSDMPPELVLESFPASKMTIGFVRSLEGGQSYVFPQVYLDYVKQQSVRGSM